MKLLGRLFGFRGRIGRGAFWLLSLPWFLFLATAFARVISDLAGEPLIPEAIFAGVGQSPLVGWFLFLAVVLALLLFISAAVRRLHDLGQSGLLVLVFFLPVVIPLSVLASGADVRWLQVPVIAIGNLALWVWGLVILAQMALLRGRQGPEDSQRITAQQVIAGADGLGSESVGRRFMLGRLFGFRGRIGRGAFWLLALPWFLILAALQFTTWTATSLERPTGFAALVYETVSDTTVGIMNGKPPLIPTLVLILAFLLLVSAIVRRLHDLGRTGALVLVIFAPGLLMLARMTVESVFDIKVGLWLTPLNPPVFYTFIALAGLLVLWGWVLLFELAFRRGRWPPSVAQGTVAQQTPAES